MAKTTIPFWRMKRMATSAEVRLYLAAILFKIGSSSSTGKLRSTLEGASILNILYNKHFRILKVKHLLIVELQRLMELCGVPLCRLLT